MTQADLKEWIEEHFGKGGYLAFVAALNAVAQVDGHKPISVAAVENWIHTPGRRPARWVDKYLPLIEARLANPQAAHLHQITLALSKEEERALRRAAKASRTEPQEFLMIAARLGVEGEIATYLRK